MAEVLVVGKKISEMDLVTDIVGDEKIPTGVVGDKAVTTGQLLTYLDNNGKVQWGRIEGDIANQADLQNQFAQQLATLQNHIQDQDNPHNVTKDQVGLGLADNTADMDKPVSTAVQEALSLKADQTYVDDSLANKTHNSLLGRDADGAHPASAISYGDGDVGNFLDKQEALNAIYSSQLLTTEQFPLIIPEVDDTGRLQRAFDASFEKKQQLHLIGDFNCSDTVYARFNFDGSASTLNYPKDYNKDALVLGAEKSTATTTRLSGAVCNFPNVVTTKTSGTNDWTSNPNSCAIKVVNSQEGKFNFGTTYMFAHGVYFLAWNTDANYNQINFGRHVFHRRPMTFHVDGSVSIASMNQNTLVGGRFAVNIGPSRVPGIYLMHFLITGGSLSSINNNLIENPSVEGSCDEYAIFFESQGTNISGISYNTIISPRLEAGTVAGKVMAFSGERVRWNQIIGGYGVNYNTILDLNGAVSNVPQTGLGSIYAMGSLGGAAAINCRNDSGVNQPTFAVYPTGTPLANMGDAANHSVMYTTSTSLITRTATSDRFKLSFNNGRMEWSGGASFDTNLYRTGVGRLKTDGSIEFVGGLGLFGVTPPAAQRTITGKKSPTTIAEQNAVLDSIVATLVAYGLASDGRTT